LWVKKFVLSFRFVCLIKKKIGGIYTFQTILMSQNEQNTKKRNDESKKQKMFSNDRENVSVNRKEKEKRKLFYLFVRFSLTWIAQLTTPKIDFNFSHVGFKIWRSFRIFFFFFSSQKQIIIKD